MMKKSYKCGGKGARSLLRGDSERTTGSGATASLYTSPRPYILTCYLFPPTFGARYQAGKREGRRGWLDSNHRQLLSCFYFVFLFFFFFLNKNKRWEVVHPSFYHLFGSYSSRPSSPEWAPLQNKKIEGSLCCANQTSFIFFLTSWLSLWFSAHLGCHRLPRSTYWVPPSRYTFALFSENVSENLVGLYFKKLAYLPALGQDDFLRKSINSICSELWINCWSSGFSWNHSYDVY